MFRGKDITGKRFGRLVAIKPTDNRQDRKIFWECICDCGTVKEILVTALVRNLTKSCGCLRRETIPPYNKLPKGEASFNTVYKSYELNSKKRDYIFPLTKDEFRNLTSSNCFYCNAPPSQILAKGNTSMNDFYIYNGIDRLDNSKGYELDNCVPCCGICNHMKGTMTVYEFIEQCQQILNKVPEEYKNVAT